MDQEPIPVVMPDAYGVLRPVGEHAVLGPVRFIRRSKERIVEGCLASIREVLVLEFGDDSVV